MFWNMDEREDVGYEPRHWRPFRRMYWCLKVNIRIHNCKRQFELLALVSGWPSTKGSENAYHIASFNRFLLNLLVPVWPVNLIGEFI